MPKAYIRQLIGIYLPQNRLSCSTRRLSVIICPEILPFMPQHISVTHMAGIVIFLLIRVKMLLYFLYGTYRNGNSYKFTPFLRIKLGTSGLIVAYKAAAAEAIAAADIVERTVDEEITVSFEYPFMNDIMRIVKEDEPAILEQSYDMDCLMRLRIRKSMMGKLRARLEKVETARIIE